MTQYHLTAECVNGHKQTIKFDSSFDREFVEMQASLLDGSSILYIYPPDEASVIGKCGICAQRIRCTVHEINE